VTDGQEKADSPTNHSFIIENGRLLGIKTGDNFDSVLTKLGEFKIVRDSFVGCEGCDQTEPIFKVYEAGNSEPVISLEHGWPTEGPDKLFRIRTTDSRFKTDKGLGINMTIKDLKKLYDIETVVADYETGLHVIVKGFNGSFGIATTIDMDWINFNKDNIPDSLIIDQIIVL
jgi:hypothetical protein